MNIVQVMQILVMFPIVYETIINYSDLLHFNDKLY